jgi:hypothetical protein
MWPESGRQVAIAIAGTGADAKLKQQIPRRPIADGICRPGADTFA